MSHRRKYIALTAVIMIVILLCIIAVCAMFIVFQNTSALVYGEDYSTFLLIPKSDYTFRLFALGKEYIVDYSSAVEILTPLKEFVTLIPSKLRFLVQLLEAAKSYIFSLF